MDHPTYQYFSVQYRGGRRWTDLFYTSAPQGKKGRQARPHYTSLFILQAVCRSLRCIWLKKWYPQVYWIADFRDLIIDPHYNHILLSENHIILFSERYFVRADLLTTVSDGLASHLRALQSKRDHLRNGVSMMQQPIPVSSDTFTMAYTGSMFLDKRNAAPIFQAIQELMQEVKMDDDIRIVYAGKDGQFWKQIRKAI